MLKISRNFFIFQWESAQAHRVRETISFLACNLAKCWLVVKFLQHAQQWICSKLKMPQHLKCLATVIYVLPLVTIPVSNCHLFSDITISQGSVATHLRYGGIFDYHFTANLSSSLTVKEFWKSVNIWQSYRHESGGPLFWNTVYIRTMWLVCHGTAFALVFLLLAMVSSRVE